LSVKGRRLSVAIMAETPKPERIAKIIAASGVCSRRAAEEMIADGRVTLNGKKLTSPAITVTPADKITIDGKSLRIQTDQTKQPRLWILHKPAGWITTNSDPEGRPTVFENIPKKIGRVISVGRLDINSEGLLLLTNHGGLARTLELPKTGLPRDYEVRVNGHVDADALTDLANGITIDGVTYGAIEAAQEDPAHTNGRNQWLHVTLHEGKNREIRRVMEALDLRVNRLIRVGYGPFELGDLAQGKLKEVPQAVLEKFLLQIGFDS
jgi:23S rRNA pseudouridine2605 synthase